EGPDLVAGLALLIIVLVTSLISIIGSIGLSILFCCVDKWNNVQPGQVIMTGRVISTRSAASIASHASDNEPCSV
uniref:Membrane protein FAM159A n=1 Tax=Steinernema glaseri TaxID=37863 RepID=A0A1I8AHY8_9BILA